MKLNPYLSPCTKLNSKWIKDLGIRTESLHLIEEKVGPNLQLVSVAGKTRGPGLCHMHPKMATGREPKGVMNAP